MATILRKSYPANCKLQRSLQKEGDTPKPSTNPDLPKLLVFRHDAAYDGLVIPRLSRVCCNRLLQTKALVVCQALG